MSFTVAQHHVTIGGRLLCLLLNVGSMVLSIKQSSVIIWALSLQLLCPGLQDILSHKYWSCSHPHVLAAYSLELTYELYIPRRSKRRGCFFWSLQVDTGTIHQDPQWRTHSHWRSLISFRRTQPPSTEVRTNQRSHCCHGLICPALDRNAGAGNIFSVIEHNTIDWGHNAGTDFIGYGPAVHALILYKYQLIHRTPCHWRHEKVLPVRKP